MTTDILENKDLLPVAPVYRYEHNKAQGFVVDMLFTLQYYILAHPERSSYIKNIDPTFRSDGMFRTFYHTEMVFFFYMLIFIFIFIYLNF